MYFVAKYFDGAIAFVTIASSPHPPGVRAAEIHSREHGDDYWRRLIVMNGDAWLRIADEASEETQDLYGGRLSLLRLPALFLYCSLTPRPKPGESEAVRE